MAENHKPYQLKPPGRYKEYAPSEDAGSQTECSIRRYLKESAAMPWFEADSSSTSEE